MSKLKGKKKLNKAVSAMLSPFGIEKAKLSTEYAYIFDKALVTYKLTEDSYGDILFDLFVKERFNYEVKNSFIFSLLHEVGHHKANDNIDGDIYDFCTQEKDRIEKAIAETENDAEVRKLEFEYFNLPDEIMATQWAVNYAKNNPLELDLMWAKVQQALKKFYKKNGLLN